MQAPIFDPNSTGSRDLQYQIVKARAVAWEAIDRRLAKLGEGRWSATVLGVMSRLAYYVPIGHRFLWWWTLFVGIGAVLNSSTGKAQLQFSDVITDVMRALLIALVANIATNIIRELLVLRSQYAATADDVRGIDQALQRHARTLEDTVRKIKTSVFDVNATRSINFLGSTLEEFHKRLKGAPSGETSDLEQQYFLNYTNALAQNAADLLCIYDEWPIEQRLFGAAALTSIIEEQRPTEGRHLVRLSTLAKIAEEICRAVDKLAQTGGNHLLQIHALVAISPQRFLNKGQGIGPGTGSNPFICGHRNFENYLEYFADRAQCNRWAGSQDAAHFHVETYRYFLSIADDNNDDMSSNPDARRLCAEFNALRARTVQEELVLVVDVEPRVPMSSSPGSHNDLRTLARRESLTGQPGQTRYTVRRRGPNDSSAETVGSVLSRFYHRPGQCKILEVRASEAINWLQDERTSKPKDYFAVAMEGRWMFCLRSLYDSDLDVADVEICRADSDLPGDGTTRWTELVAELNRLFRRDVPGGLGNAHDIESYRLEEGALSAVEEGPLSGTDHTGSVE
ncbi:MAG TPA: hypothetical protein VGG72_17095 [Bryobacteraceae bacterium]